MEPDPARVVSPAPNPSHQPFLRAARSTAFKREERRKHKEQKRQRKRQERLALALEQWEPLGPPPPPAAISPSGVPSDDKPWPCDPPPPPDAAPSAAWSWGPPAEPSADCSWGLPAESVAQPPPPLVAATCPQAAAVRASRAFFGEHVDNDDDGGGDDEDLEEEEGNATRFFEDLLEKDAGLRGFYEAERETGRFLCLVCEGIGVRAGKRFPGCAALVQHAGTVARTKRRLAYRAFADAVGRLLGWGARRTTPFPVNADSGNDGASDQAGHLDASESAEMEVA